MAATFTEREARLSYLQAFPPGSDDLYDWERTESNIGLYFGVKGKFWREQYFDRIAQLRREINPATATVAGKIPDWEAALGLSTTPIAQFGTEQQRRDAIIAWLRQTGTFSLSDIRAIIQPYFLYADANDIQIIETDRNLLRIAHTYTGTGFGPTIGPSNEFLQVTVGDDPRVSPAGAILEFTLSGQLDEISFSLIGPDGTSIYSWPAGFLGDTAVISTNYQLNVPYFAGKPINGAWTFNVVNLGTNSAQLHTWSLFVEGLGRNTDGSEGLGAAMFEFVVVADYGLLGQGYDLVGAQRAIDRFKPAHVNGTITYKAGISPDACAIPDTSSAVPDAAIPCS